MIYIASKAKYGPEWVRLRKTGYPLSSTWIDQSGAGDTLNWPVLWMDCINEVAASSALVLICRPGDTLKGAWVEMGAALAHSIPVFTFDISDYSIRHHPLVVACESEGDAFSRALWVKP